MISLQTVINLELEWINIDTIYYIKNNKWDKNPYDITVSALLSMDTESDIVSLHLEPILGYQLYYEGKNQIKTDDVMIHNLYWSAYAELYITPVEDLEWYFEMDVNNGDADSTGITWYLPEF
ncbi:hypothetical protein [Brachyspira innocens]|uniref:hypothetical protein n=1 Tax=Brachyspira innocens TaxID=13264 RepID=UPI0034E95B80